mgnify:CR=1 FL=1
MKPVLWPKPWDGFYHKTSTMTNNTPQPIPEILLVSSYPPREYGIATFSHDLRTALHHKFRKSFSVSVCALEAAEEKHQYPPEVRYVLHTAESPSYHEVADAINLDPSIKLVLLQHEFGFFGSIPEQEFLYFLHQIKKPLILAFHTVLPKPEEAFTVQNQEVNLDDANGRAVWALGHLISKQNILPESLVLQAKMLLEQALPHLETIHSTRAMAFAIKGLHYSLSANPSAQKRLLLETLANRLVQMFRHEDSVDWHWFEPYLTYGNSTLPEAMLCAWLSTGNPVYKNIAHQSFDFLLQNTFTEAGIKVVPNDGWMLKGSARAHYGEQPIDVAYTILALQLFYEVFGDERYRKKIVIAFNWFLGQNHLQQIIYNPCTGGCYDGLEETQVNMNQGAESTVSYLMARLALEKSFSQQPLLISLPSNQTNAAAHRNPKLFLIPPSFQHGRTQKNVY